MSVLMMIIIINDVGLAASYLVRYICREYAFIAASVCSNFINYEKNVTSSYVFGIIRPRGDGFQNAQTSTSIHNYKNTTTTVTLSVVSNSMAFSTNN